MNRFLLALFVASCTVATHAATSTESSADLLFVKSDIPATPRKTAAELRLNPHNINAHFVSMEAARLELRSPEELAAAIAVLQNCHGDDPRARVAAGRIRDLAADTPWFRSAVLQIAALIGERHSFARELSDALLTAAADGVRLPRQLHLTRRVRNWQVAGPFGQFSNVDFDRTWPPEQDELGKNAYGERIREDVQTESGWLELPDYFPQAGIYYAAASLPVAKAGKYKLTVESDGTFDLWLDGKRLFQRDARFRQQNAISRIEAHIAAGEHHLLLKLQTATLPLRVWIESTAEDRTELAGVLTAEKDYVNAVISLMDGDARPALLLKEQSAIARVLRAETLLREGDDDEARHVLRIATESDPHNLLATFLLAKNTLGDEQYEEAAAQLGKILQVSREYAPAEELKFQLAAHFDWREEQEESLKRRLRLHPSCAALADAVKFYEKAADKVHVATHEATLARCSFNPRQYWELLSQHGRHQQVVTSINRSLRRHPSDRRLLTIAMREAVLANQLSVAEHYARRLRAVAPNWKWTAQLVSRPELILDSPSSYPAAADFYKPFVRDPLPMMADRPAQPPNARVLINDRVIQLDAAGAWVYQHTVAQAFDKKGIALCGEVELPRSVDLLQLHTIKRNGELVEPERSDGKSTVSMPSFTEGDAVEIAWLQHLSAESLAASPEVLDFIFGSIESPTVSAILTVIRKDGPTPLLWSSPELKQVQAEQKVETQITTWKASNIAASPEEPASAQYERRPRVLWLALDKAGLPSMTARLRESLIEATKITPRIGELAARIEASTAESKVGEAYRLVTSTIDNQMQNWLQGNVLSADESFQQHEGNRAAALIALLSALGFQADFELSAELGKHNPTYKCADSRCYTRPLVRVYLENSKTVLLDPQMSGLAAGALSPEVEGEQAIVVSRLSSNNPETVTIPRSTDQLSTATADLQVDNDGSIAGAIHIHFGSLRGAQMRETLEQLSATERKTYFEEIAGRILPNARDVSAMVIHEEDSDQSLELELKATAKNFARWDGVELQIGQIVPALGLGRLYATLPQRREALLLDAPLVESSEFFVHLPAGVIAARLPESVDLKSNFGEYRTEFKLEGDLLHIIRSFRIPMQEVAAAEYPGFSRFAIRIDNAERELIQLRKAPSQALANDDHGAQTTPGLH